MTTFGKLLVFVNLVFGVGAATWAAAVYTQRPAWFDPAPDGGTPKGAVPGTFAGLSAEIDALTRAAESAGKGWSDQYARLTRAEALRASRQAKMFGGGKGKEGLLDYARAGDYPPARALAKGKGKDYDPAFFHLKEDPATKLLNLDPNPAEAGVVVLGPDGQPLRGADTLLARFNADAKAIADAAAESKKVRAGQKVLGEEATVFEGRVLKQRQIREDVRVEAAYLAGVEVNAVADLDWARTRKTQLTRRLAAFGKRD